jgi:germination protein M
MKKQYLVLLVVILLISNCVWQGTGGEPETEAPYVLYFQERDLENAVGDGVLRREASSLQETEGTDAEQIAKALVLELLEGPSDETLKRTIPAGTTLRSLHVEGTRAIVDLSNAYGLLSGIELTLADQSIALTLTRVPEILSVKITVQGEELAYRGKQIFTGRDVLLVPAGDVVGTVNATLYFMDEEGMPVSESRTLDLYEGDTQVSAVIRAMESAPADKGLVSAFPEGFRTGAIWTEDGICYVNLISGLAKLLPQEVRISVTIDALGKALCSLDSVTEVRFLVDGEYSPYYGSSPIKGFYTG